MMYTVLANCLTCKFGHKRVLNLVLELSFAKVFDLSHLTCAYFTPNIVSSQGSSLFGLYVWHLMMHFGSSFQALVGRRWIIKAS